MTVLCIIPGPSHVYTEQADDRPTRWCFTCRKHLPHVWQLIGDPPPRNWEFTDWPELDGYAAATIIEPSWYEPNWVPRCPAGHSDIDFPGSGIW